MSKQSIEKMAKVLIDYTKKKHIMASTVILTDYAEELYSAGYRQSDELIAENEQLRERHAALDRQIRADARREFAEKLKNYYFNTLKGSTNCTLVAYHIDQILADMERKEEQ